MGQARVVVIGGGLGGLMAAVRLARGGAQVTVCERAEALGGRAATHQRGEFRLNLGPHALYPGGEALLAEVGVVPSGGKPSTSGGYALAGGRAHTLPAGLFSMMTTGLLTLGEKLESARLFASLPRLDAAALIGVSVEEWLSSTIEHAAVRELLRALVRLSTYSNDPTR